MPQKEVPLTSASAGCTVRPSRPHREARCPGLSPYFSRGSEISGFWMSPGFGRSHDNRCGLTHSDPTCRHRQCETHPRLSPKATQLPLLTTCQVLGHSAGSWTRLLRLQSLNICSSVCNIPALPQSQVFMQLKLLLRSSDRYLFPVSLCHSIKPARSPHPSHSNIISFTQIACKHPIYL